MSRVLLIEPDEVLASTIARFLDKNEIETTVSHDARQAVACADKAKPDLVVLELAMPKNNGLAFLQEFRSYTDWAELPVIIYSRIPRADAGLSEAEWKKQGVHAYLYKPTQTLANLVVSIRGVL